MKEEELMVGDFVYFFCDIYEKVKVTKEDFSNPTFFPRTKPISITPEILEKNGFIRNLDHPIDTEWEFYGDGYEIVGWEHRNGDCYISRIEGETTAMDCKIFHVHELQHALRLCKIEKEIEL